MLSIIDLNRIKFKESECHFEFDVLEIHHLSLAFSFPCDFAVEANR